jgi:hypothetical protein
MRLRPRHIVLGVLAAIALAIVAGILALEPIATWRTRKALEGLQGMTARFAAVHVKLADLSYEIDDLHIDRRAPGGKAVPYFEARRIRLGLLGREILRGHLVGRLDLDRPRMHLVQTTPSAPEETTSQVKQSPEVAKKLEDLTPFLLDRVQVRGGEVVWVDARDPGHPELRLKDIEATLENFASRPALSRGEPTVLALRGVVQRSGKASLFATGDPLAKSLTFAGQGRIDGLALAELGPVIGAKSDVAPDKGTLDMSIRFQAENGKLTGGIRPILRNAGTRASKPGLGAKLKSFLADATLNIFKDDVPNRHAVATTIPIEGRVDDPNLQLVPTILGVVRNAFVRGLSDSLRGLPPPKAKERQSTLEQARRSLGAGRQPRAQPEGKGP